MIVRICRGQPELAVRVVAPGCDGGQLVDYEDMELCILAPKCTCEGPFSKLYFKGCGWWGHDIDRWNEQQVPPEQMPVLVYPAFDVNDNGEIVLDFAIDADYIYAAFMEQYGIDLLTARLHWYSFNALLHGLHDTELNNIINARLYKPSGRNDEYEKTKQKQYEAWRLPQPADNEPDEALEDFLGALKG